MKNRWLNKAFLLCCLLYTTNAHADTKLLSLESFIKTATTHDKQFEQILIDRLPLQYRRAALLPTKDTIVSLKQRFHLYLNGIDAGASSEIALEQLFPDTGTTLSTSLIKPSTASTSNPASLQILVSQPIARNAFGNNYKLQDKLIGLENEISEYQIVEAYEDYLASLTSAWYNWYSAYENLRVSQASYDSSQKLLENILERQKQRIALPIDVNKMRLSLISKRERLVVLQEIYDHYTNLIMSAAGTTKNQLYVPAKPTATQSSIVFQRDYQDFTENSRTYYVLDLLEKQSNLSVKKAADDLMPSTNLLMGYQLDAQQWGLKEQENSFFAGISLSWPIQRSVEKAKLKIAKLERKKTTLSNINKYKELETNLHNLYLQIVREQELMDIAQQKIELAEKILVDETENYSFGKVSLNDYIDAVNDVDENRFSYTDHSVKLSKLFVEWLRLTDRLVKKEEVLSN